MGRKNNPIAILGVVISIIVGLIIAIFVKNVLPDTMMKFSGIIFWVAFLVVAGVGTLFSGKLFNDRDRR